MGDKAPDVPLDQVEWRVQGTPANGSVSVVAYLDAPTVADLLDDWVGPARWADRYEPMGNGEKALWCHLSVKFEDEWVTKVDLGVPSNMEAAKGLVSDAFKRVAMRKWGVGRNVFTLPVLRIRKFRQYQRNGKDQAALTGESAVEIQQRLTALGFEDAAKQTRVAAADDETSGDSGAQPSPGGTPEAPAAEVDSSQSGGGSGGRECTRCGQTITGAVEKADGGWAHKGTCP